MKHIIIDNTTPETVSILQVTDESRGICWVKLYEAEGRKVIFAPCNGKLLSKLDLLSLQYLYWNLFEEVPLAEYKDLADAIMPHIEYLTIDLIPLAELQWRVELLETKDGPTIDEHEAGMPGGIKILDEPDPEDEAEQEAISKIPAAPAKIPGRPKAGSSTAKVWDIADGVLAAAADGLDLNSKELRTAIIVACEADGINKSTAATQYSKWKRAQKGSN